MPDTATYTPNVVRIPVPSPNLFDTDPSYPRFVEVQLNGEHQYDTKTWVGNVKQGVTAEMAFEALRYHAAPLQLSRISKDGDITNIPLGPLGGKVEHFIFPEQLTIVNTTFPRHVFHPGNVFRRVVQEGDDIYIVSKGYGVGNFPTINEAVSKLVWPVVDQSIRERLNSPVGPSLQDFGVSLHDRSNTTSGDTEAATRTNQVDTATAMGIRERVVIPPTAAPTPPNLPAIGPRPFLPRAFLPGALGTTPTAD